MAEKLVTIASHLTVQEAHLAKNSLDTEGIPSFLADEESENMLGLVVGFVKGVKILVADHQAERASDILATLARGPADAPLDERLATTRTCPVCGEAFEPDCDYCPQCGPPADHEREPPESWQEAKPPQADDDEITYSEGDQIARRALWASVLGVVFCPVLTFYSIYLIIRICFSEGDLQRKSWTALYFTLAFCVVELGLVLVFWKYVVAR